MEQQQSDNEQAKQDPESDAIYETGTHAAGCACSLCQEHRELSTIIASAEQRKFYVNQIVILRLDTIEREIGGQR